MKKQELIEFIVETLKARSTGAAIDYGSLTRDQLLGQTVDTLAAIKEHLESEEVEE